MPDKIAAIEGERLRLKLVRHESGDCTKEVVFPGLGIRKELPSMGYDAEGLRRLEDVCS